MWGQLLEDAAKAAQGPNPETARPLIARLLEAAPGNADALTLAGIVAQRTGDGDGALAAFAAARDADPGDPGRHQNLAVALKNKGAIEEALAAFGAALKLRPGHAATMANLGSCLIAAQRYGEAVDTLETVLKTAPGHPDALVNMGVALSRLGRHEEAARRYRQALDARPGHVESALNLVDALAALGRRDEAETLARQVLTALPGHVRATNQLGLLREAAGDARGAAEVFRAGFDPAAPNHALGVNLARALIRAERCEEALKVTGFLQNASPTITTPLALSLAALEKLSRAEERDALMAIDRFVTVHDIEAVHGFADLQQFNAKLVHELRDHPSLTEEPEGLVTRGGRQSDDLAKAQSPAIAALCALATARLADEHARLAAMAADHPFLRALPADWSLTLWGTILRPGGEVGAHIHAPNWISGVYYPEYRAPAASGDEGAFAIGTLPQELGGGGRMRVMQPRAGRMILFPSYLWHATMPFGGNEERISFAFDLVPTGVGQPHRLR
ncbi:tetratricopeptide repeat protein [Novosphingobium mathurense]|uniref:Flp pilus assembly protein TadD, contains TPR repeats n=1 Tax=Novosphingobium mathurense TaxID=428990 RepID=A0A1U6HW04_9SPHN|nr:tetratricopeptide repeat protein [Novosphingobium mathurense]SLJ99861.1 Flp pilus assembly protein TadD, contains TPR repeats [Novosphingobium mathurense]